MAKLKQIRKRIRRGARNVGSSAKLIGYDLPKEIAKRAVSHRYTYKKTFGKDLPKK